MGDRGNIKIKFQSGGEIFFYTHWTGYRIPQILASALDRGRGRWNDESYLARIIFSEMIKDEVLDETGYGIAPYICDNEYPIPEVDMGTRTVDGVPFGDYVQKHKPVAS